MMKRNIALALVALVMVSGMSLYAEEGQEGGDTNMVAIDKLPAAVKEAATKQVDKIELTKAHTEKADNGNTVYVIEGHVGDKQYVVRVTVDADGKVVETKSAAVEEKKEGGADNDNGAGGDVQN
ncbi:MAG: hypothetical protein ACREJ2_05340 [Planctomycetota bacterium]